VASAFAILPPPPSRFCPLPTYCPISWHLTAESPRGWHPTAPLLLAPDGYSPGGTRLPLTGWHPTATHRLAPDCHSPAGTRLPLTGWQPTATHQLAPYCHSPAGTLLLLLRSVDPSSVRPSRSIALPPWLLSNALDPCNELHECASGYCGPMVSVVSPVADHQSSNHAPKGS